MKDLAKTIQNARCGDLDSFGRLVTYYQDMAYAYAYSLLGDFHLAQDATQEAFIDAYRHISSLRVPEAFPGWFRRIVLKHCNRLTRGKSIQTVPLDAAREQAGSELRPDEALIRNDMRRSVLGALQALSQDQRSVTSLYYINGYSQAEVADFLDVPITTVNNRLHAARRQLKERMVTMVQQELTNNALPKDEFCHIVLDKLSKQQAGLMAGSPVNKFADLVITQALRDKCKQMNLSLDENGTVCLEALYDCEWKEWAPPPARIIPPLLSFLAAAATSDANSDDLAAGLPFVASDGQKHIATLKVTSITVGITLPEMGND
jgi:RNA polymerase sigma factor (sigma-70 family)